MHRSWLVALALVVATSATAHDWHSACATGDGSYELRAGRHISCAAYGWQDDQINATGWQSVSIESNSQLDDLSQAFAAGWLEAALTTTRIYQAKVLTFFAVFTNSTPPQPLIDWWKTNLAWTRDQLRANNVSTAPLDGVFDNTRSDGASVTAMQRLPRDGSAPPSAAYWLAAASYYSQLKGIWQGYSQFAPAAQALSWMDLHLLQVGSDCEDLLTALGLRASLAPQAANVQHCSALIKLTPDYSDVFMSHVTWSSYCNMLRQWKRLRLPYSFAQTIEVQMSSYPGELWSNDDYYTLKEQRMVVMETTNAILNETLLTSILSPLNTLPVGVRAMTANRLATSGASWADAFAQYNNGLYNNEWQAVDLKQFVRGQAPATGSGVLFIVAQIPGAVHARDMSDLLASQLYWPSYNTPFFPEQFAQMGYASWAQKYPAYFSYDSNPRANIFRRDQAAVTSIDDMKRIMTYNQWQTDPLSLGNAGEAISSRADLITCPNPVPENDWFTAGPSGAIDAKITSAAKMLTDGGSVAICGPTHADQPPFTWKGVFPDQLHIGQPEVFDFDWVEFNLTE